MMFVENLGVRTSLQSSPPKVAQYDLVKNYVNSCCYSRLVRCKVSFLVFVILRLSPQNLLLCIRDLSLRSLETPLWSEESLYAYGDPSLRSG
jgi:hypothetical protein